MGVFNEIFGLDKEKVWRQFAKEINGNYIEGHYGKADKVEIVCNKWAIIFDTYAVSNPFSSRHETSGEFTIIKVPFFTHDKFQFSIKEKGILNSIGKLFGAQDIQIGDSEFDKRFVIKGNDENKLLLLFSNRKIMELISLQKNVALEVVDEEGFWGTKLPEGVFEITYVIDGVVTDIAHLKSLYDLFVELTNQFYSIGSSLDKEVILNKE
jgi:hypothetical protein